MLKDRQEQTGALLSAEEIARNQAERNSEPPPGPDAPPEDTPGSPDGQNQGDENRKEQDVRQKMTADQYLGRAPQGAGIGELVRSLYKTKIMSFEDWESTVKALLKKQVR
ncbi:MAG: hypothetical protein LBG27_03235 [Spirochaetaceae bacterium]|jgi:hypothetical protein|nr:hypothetical protein [Spirochaetaceae bacterium]